VVIHQATYRWEPIVKIDGGKSYPVPQVRCEECPVSFITEQSKALVEIESMNQHAQKATGATLYGSNAGHWPAVWHDVVTTIQMQRGLDEAAFQRSMNHGR
jgi:hypothetical protein